MVVHFDPPNDHKDYLHRSGRTARAGAAGLVVALAEEGQVREVERMHQAAGVHPDRHRVTTGHDVVREIATTGTPIPPPEPQPATRPAEGRPRGGAARSGQSRRARPDGFQPGEDRTESGAGRPRGARGQDGDTGRPARPASAGTGRGGTGRSGTGRPAGRQADYARGGTGRPRRPGRSATRTGA
jgi:superfamily II DNA/RNA helicase